MQMLNSPYKSAVQCCIDIYRREGFPAFYRSYTTQLTMNIPFQSIHFMIYEFAQKLTNKDGAYNPPAHMLSGAAAGAVAAAITTPLDVCKTLLNTQQGGATAGLIEAARKVRNTRFHQLSLFIRRSNSRSIGLGVWVVISEDYRPG